MNVAEKSFEGVLRDHQQTAPVKVGEIAKALGVRVVISELPRGVSGKLSRESEDHWVIRVNRHEHKNRQRFTIAHEIAHFVLHRSEIKHELTDDTFYRSGLSERREWEANRLAAEILMPWDLLRQEMQGGQKRSPAELAEIFGVSEAAMHIRLGLPT